MLKKLKDYRRIVVKIGSALLVDRATGLKRDWLESLGQDIAALHHAGVEVLVVSSGAIALGRTVLGLPKKALKLEESQAAAAAGQIALAKAYADVLGGHSIRSGQILVTLSDTEERRRYLNARATLNELLALGALPVINENDTVSVDELKLGDNDNLAAIVAALVDADALFIATDIDGLYTADPRSNPDAQPINQVAELTPDVLAMAGGSGSAVGTGGMQTKLQAAAKAGAAGIDTFLFNGRSADVVRGLAQGRLYGTRLHAGQSRIAARKYWLKHAPLEPGAILIDAGAARALRDKGASLLPGGVVGAEGEFRRGDMVEVRLFDARGQQQVARGVSQYSAVDIRRISQHHTREIESILGYNYGDNVVHRDDLVLL